MNTKTKESYECRVDATVSKYKGSGEFLFMKLDGKFHWKFCFKPSLVKRTIIVLLWVLILMVYSTFRVYSISLSTFNHDNKYHWPFNIVKTPQLPTPPSLSPQLLFCLLDLSSNKCLHFYQTYISFHTG